MPAAKLAYISFDTVPAPKGAAVHIAAFTQALAQTFGSVNLVTVAPTREAVPEQETWLGVRHTALPAIGETLIDRVLHFRDRLGQWWQGQHFEAVQIRSIFEGLPIAQRKAQLCDRLIFEVNGLPSIELKYRYPAVADDRELTQKLLAQEQICLEAADLVITPSTVTQAHLVSRGIPLDKIRVIPNGVDLAIFRDRPPGSMVEIPNFQLLYFGTLSAWQGVNLAIAALALYRRDFAAELTIVGSNRGQQAMNLQRLAAKLGVAEAVRILEPVSQSELVALMHQADAIVAPLTPNDRNLVQGCCPLKVLEGMATGTPVIASDLPVVREIGVNEKQLLLVQPNSAKAIKDAMLLLRSDARLRERLASAARRHVEEFYTWERAGAALVAAYEALGIKRAMTP